MDKFDFRIENQFEELVFEVRSKCVNRGMPENMISISYSKNKPDRLVFNKKVSNLIFDYNFNKLKVVRNKLTSEIFIVINKEIGLSIGLPKSKVACIQNKQFLEFIVKTFNISLDGNRHITISNNLSKTSDCLTYKLSDYK